MEKDNLDKLIEIVYKKEYSKIDDIENIEVPNIHDVLNKFEMNLEERNKIKKKDSNVWNKFRKNLALTAAFLLVILISGYITETPEVKAVKFNIMKFFETIKNGSRNLKYSNIEELDDTDNEVPSSCDGNTDQIEKVLSFEDAQNQTSFNICKPNFLPKGYEIKEVRLIIEYDGNERVKQKYTNDDKTIIIKQSLNTENTNTTVVTDENNRCENVLIDDNKVTIITNDSTFSMGVWFTEKFKFEITVLDIISDENLIKIIEELK